MDNERGAYKVEKTVQVSWEGQANNRLCDLSQVMEIETIMGTMSDS